MSTALAELLTYTVSFAFCLPKCIEFKAKSASVRIARPGGSGALRSAFGHHLLGGRCYRRIVGDATSLVTDAVRLRDRNRIAQAWYSLMLSNESESNL